MTPKSEKTLRNVLDFVTGHGPYIFNAGDLADALREALDNHTPPPSHDGTPMSNRKRMDKIEARLDLYSRDIRRLEDVVDGTAKCKECTTRECLGESHERAAERLDAIVRRLREIEDMASGAVHNCKVSELGRRLARIERFGKAFVTAYRAEEEDIF